MVSRVTSRRLVGRTAELAELQAALRDAADGRPSLAFVAGESGVGKSRLLHELERAAAAPRAGHAPARVLGGDCIQLGSGELPYAPLVAALRPLARAGDPVLDGLPAAARAELARIVPGLATDGVVPSPPSAHGPHTDQTRLFEALLLLLDGLAREAPLLLSIEDLHWADGSTRAFLQFLSRSLCDERVLVVATYRHDELHRRHPLRPVLAELEREPRARRIELTPLRRDELAEQLGDILGAPAEAGLLGRVWARGEGNPLFSEELLAAELDGGGDVPPTLRDALMLRIERLPAAAQELLRLLAVAQRAHHETLLAAGELDGRELRDAVREAMAHHLVVLDDEERYAYRHALLREVVEDDLLPGERVELHRRLARALEGRMADGGEDDPDLASALAHHHAQAGDQPQALRAATRAAAAAARVRAYAEEAELLERALALWSAVPDAEAVVGAPRALILCHAARAQESIGAQPRAEALLEEALSAVDERADPRQAAVVLEHLARVRWAQMRSEDAIDAATRGLALLEHDRCAERALLLGWMAKARMLQGRYREAIDLAREVLVLADETGDRLAEVHARNALGVSLAATGDVDAGARELRRAIALAAADGREERRATGYHNLADALHTAGRTREALAVAQEGLALTGPRTHERAWMEANISEYALSLGDWELADRVLAPLDRWMWTNGRVNVTLRRAELALGRGDLDLAARLLDEAEPLAAHSAEPQWHGPLGTARAALELRRGDLDAAWRAVETALERIEYCTEDAGRIVHVASWGVRVAARLAQRARDRHEDPGPAVARAEAMAERVEAAAQLGGAVEHASRLYARADLGCAHGRPVVADWRAAAAAWEALEYPYAVASTLLRTAEIEAADGDRDAAGRSAARALAIARRLGARWLEEELLGLAKRARLRLDEAEGAPAAAGDPVRDGAAPSCGAAGPAAQDDPFGLTPRERQVLELVAGGATNREVGERLFMAEKTASVHVSRILAKLDVRSRTEAAAVAHRLGLAGDEAGTVAGAAPAAGAG
ncbi:AAA family ATPase [Patulibacter sp. SYSU D01012]|uniref:helix-turn-helix transcriptional regulator n=1 Tax=Patulibacter sp. SYSU D01012 TaxID=2817381 RepID=UPI001B312260|nr:AAA family ATPase [Patulibacter sp. SYSU D01012]